MDIVDSVKTTVCEGALAVIGIWREKGASDTTILERVELYLKGMSGNAAS